LLCRAPCRRLPAACRREELAVPPFTIPPSRIDPAALPAPLLTSEPHSFAQSTFRERVPAIVRETLALNGFSGEIRRSLEELHAEVAGGPIRALREEASDRDFWNAVSAPYLGRAWLDVPWYWAEAFFYRRILEATRYFQPGAWQGCDPFRPKKATELAPDAAPLATDALLRRLPDEAIGQFEMLLQGSLWGNRIDLSYEAAARLGRPTGSHEERANLLVDDTPALWEFLRTGERRRVALIADNAGTELLMDLALADFLLDRDLVGEIHLHLKPHPFFVSDAMPEDLTAGLDALGTGGEMAAALARSLRGYLARGRLQPFTHWHYGTSLFFFQLPDDLRGILAEMDLVILKGDANYRRLLGDAHWPPTTSFQEATRYFPAPLAALRTLKAEIIVGLKPGEAERLGAEDAAWLVDGKRGVVQARL
jgi:uncharacterized protein with ATP-grasp and redox domains